MILLLPLFCFWPWEAGSKGGQPPRILMNTFVPVPGPQTDYLMSDARECFFGGLPGGMKSKSTVVDALGLYQQEKLGKPAIHHPLYHAVIFRKEERQLAQLIRYANELYPSQGMLSREGGKEWYIRDGGRVNFSHMHAEEDYLLWQGHELAYIGFDELPQFSLNQYGGIMPWNRVPEGSGLDVFMRATGNPIGPGVPWVRDRFILRCTPFVIHEFDYEFEGKKIPWSRQFIPSSFRDNPYMADQYPASIINMPNPQIRQALLNPDPIAAWSIVMGSFFSQFNNVQHIIKRSDEKDTLERLKRSHVTRVEGLDYGFRAPFCTLWAWEDTEGDIYITNEHYETQRTIEHHAGRIHRIRNYLGWETDSHKVTNFKTIGDPSIWFEGNRAVLKTDKTIGQELARRGIFCQRANNDIIQGLSVIHDRMYTDGVIPPRLHIFESCQNLIGEIVNAVTDERDMERIAEECPDHALDALRYLCMYLNKGRKPKEMQEVPDLSFAKLVDMTGERETSNPYYRT